MAKRVTQATAVITDIGMNKTVLKGLALSLVLTGCQPTLTHDATRHSIQVSGEYSLQAIPDRARLQFSVEHMADTIDVAQEQADEVVNRVLALCDRLEIERTAVQTTGVNIRPEYQWQDEPRRRTLTGYVVSRQIAVDLKDITVIGRLMSEAVKAGVNQVQPPVFELSRRDSLTEEALAEAVKVARGRAEALAQADGQTVGHAVSIRALDTQGAAPQPMMMRMAAEAADAAGSYETGRMAVAVRVEAEFSLKP